MSSFNVNFFPIVDTDPPTTKKQRFRARGKPCFVSHESESDPAKFGVKRSCAIKLKAEWRPDLLVFSDFNYGCLPQNVVQVLLSEAKENNVMVAADSQASSQVSDISRFKGADLLTPTEYEARLSLKNQSDGIPVLAAELANVAEAKALFLKLVDGFYLLHQRRG